MADLNSFDWIVTALVITGALNWGIIGVGLALGVSDPISSWNSLNVLFGGIADGMVESIIYILVGLAGLYEIYVGYKFAALE